MDVRNERLLLPLALACAECADSLVLSFEIVGDRHVLTHTLSALGWVLSVATATPRDGVETQALVPLCDRCARRVHGDPLVDAAHRLIADKRS